MQNVSSVKSRSRALGKDSHSVLSVRWSRYLDRFSLLDSFSLSHCHSMFLLLFLSARRRAKSFVARTGWVPRQENRRKFKKKRINKIASQNDAAEPSSSFILCRSHARSCVALSLFLVGREVSRAYSVTLRWISRIERASNTVKICQQNVEKN